MSAVGNLSAAQLRAHVAALAKSGRVLHDHNFGDFPIHELETNSHSRCGYAAEAVEDHLNAQGVRVRGLDLTSDIPWMANHYATEVPTREGPHVVDLAYSQYQHAGYEPAEWPLVEHRDRYLRRGFRE